MLGFCFCFYLQAREQEGFRSSLGPLCGVCMFSLCLCGFFQVLWLPPQSRHIHGVRLMGIFKLTVGVNVSVMVGCFSALALQQIADLSSVYCTASS